jgi:hypothetical protein
MQIRQVVPSALSTMALSLALTAPARAQLPESLPVCNNNGPYVEECSGQSTYVPVTSAGSFDPDGTSATFLWFEECPWGFFDDPTAADPNFVIDIGGLCVRTCVIQLRVFSGGQVKSCNSTATAQDTTPPQIFGPPDIIDIWGIPTDQGSTGSATAIDECDPSPTVGLINQTIIPQTGPGLEQTIVRTWEARDYCGHTSQVSQTITLLSPLSNSSNLEVDVNQCSDVFDRGDASSTFDVTLLGKVGTLVTGIKLNTLRLSKLGDQANFVYPLNPSQFAPADVAIRAASKLGDCNPPGTDGLKDLKLRFNRTQVRNLLALDALPVGTPVYIAITGLRNNNTSFIAGAKMIVQ